MNNETIVERLKELKALPGERLNDFLVEVFSHHLKCTNQTGSELAKEFEFFAELRMILDEL